MNLPPGPYRTFNCYGCWRVEGQFGVVVMSGFDEDDANTFAQALNERESLIRTVLEVVTDEHVMVASCGPEDEDWNDHACKQWNKLVQAVRPYISPTTPKAKS